MFSGFYIKALITFKHLLSMSQSVYLSKQALLGICFIDTVEPELMLTCMNQMSGLLPVSRDSPKLSQYITGSLHIKQVTSP